MTAESFNDEPAEAALSPREVAQAASLDRVAGSLEDDARSWGRQLEELSALAARAEKDGPQTRRTLALDLAGSWRIGQLTAERWLAEAARFYDALPLTLSMLSDGTLLRHQATVLLHGTADSTPEVARSVEAEVLPAGAALCPSDLRDRVKKVRLRIDSEQNDPADAERQEAEMVAGRRTWARPTDDGMAVAGALLTPEQGMAWAAGMDALERRERLADRAAGIVRTAEQRRADLFAALPALVLVGTAADDRHRRAAGLPGGGRISSQPDESEVLFEQDRPVPPPWTFSPEQVAAQIVLNVHVPVSTVLELSKEPGTLDRYGPVSAEHIRLLRPTSFRRVMVDAQSGRPIAVDDTTSPAADTAKEQQEQIRAMLRPDVIVDADEPRHDPSTRLARLIDLRDARCCGPGCASTRCDRDHLDPWPTGPTTPRTSAWPHPAATAPSTTAGPSNATTTAASPGTAPSAVATSDPAPGHRHRRSTSGPNHQHHDRPRRRPTTPPRTTAVWRCSTPSPSPSPSDPPHGAAGTTTHRPSRAALGSGARDDEPTAARTDARCGVGVVPFAGEHTTAVPVAQSESPSLLPPPSP